MPIPLLVTSAIAVSAPYTKVVDPTERLRFTIDALGEWLKIDPSLKIVVCDGSGFNLQPELEKQFSTTAIECLHFQNDVTLVKERGKGYGEGEIIAYALKHSRTLAINNNFAKCTGRLWVRNYKGCLKYWNNRLLCDLSWDDCCDFRRPVRMQEIDTRFYIVDKALYASVFADAHRQVDDRRGHFLEHAFRDAALGANLSHFAFPRKPLVTGLSGSMGTFYRPTRKGLIKDYGKRCVVRIRTNWVTQGL